MTDSSGEMHDIEVRVGKHVYTISTDESSEESVRGHVAILSENAAMLLQEHGHVPEKLLLLLSAIQALEEQKAERSLEQEVAADAVEVTLDASRRIRSLVTRLDR